MKLKYICPNWGQGHSNAPAFIHKVLEADYEGIEICLPETAGPFTREFIAGLDRIYETMPDFYFIPQQLISPENETVPDFIHRMEKKLQELAAYHPTFINSHTGKDFFSFDDNCRIIEACLQFSSKTRTRILHETHRGRFSFHAASLLPYLEKFPELELVGDFSHFCTVSESLLHDQEAILEKIIPHVSHIHARIGHEQGPQVNDPFAPEWGGHVKRFLEWWDKIISIQEEKGRSTLAICPEFGPAPYMPALPYTQQPISDQWQINLRMKDFLKVHYSR